MNKYRRFFRSVILNFTYYIRLLTNMKEGG